jgi:hypothetical protein
MCRSAWRAWYCMFCFFPLLKWQTHKKIGFSIRITSHNRQIKISYMFNRSCFRYSTSNMTILNQGLFFAVFFTSSSTSLQPLHLHTLRFSHRAITFHIHYIWHVRTIYYIWISPTIPPTHYINTLHGLFGIILEFYRVHIQIGCK